LGVVKGQSRAKQYIKRVILSLLVGTYCHVQPLHTYEVALCMLSSRDWVSLFMFHWLCSNCSSASVIMGIGNCPVPSISGLL